MVQKSGVRQLRLVVYTTIYRVFYISGGAGFLPTVPTPKLVRFVGVGENAIKKATWIVG